MGEKKQEGIKEDKAEREIFGREGKFGRNVGGLETEGNRCQWEEQKKGMVE